MLHHRRDRVVVDEEAVLDAVDAGGDGVADRVGTVGVGRDAQSATVCLVDDRPQFLVRIVLRAGWSGHRHHPARAAHLDQFGAVLDLVAHRFADFVDPVRDAFLDGQVQHVGCEGREHRRVQVPSGGSDGVTGGHHPRPLDPACVDRPAERNVEQVAAGLDEQAQVAHGGEPRPQGAAGVANRAQHPGRRVILNLGQPRLLAPAAHQQVDLHVHQPGQQDLVTQIDQIASRVVLWLPARRAADTDDPIALDPHHAGPPDLAGVDVEQAGGLDRYPGRGARAKGIGHRQITGSRAVSSHAAPLSGTRGCFHASIGNDTMTSDCIMCMSVLASSGRSLSG